MILTQEQLTQRKNRVFVTIFVEELDGELMLGSLSAAAMLEASEVKARPGNHELELISVILRSSIVNEKKLPVFDADSIGEFMNSISPDAMKEIAEKVPLSKAAEKKVEKAKAEALAKAQQAEQATPVASPSDSVSP